jgi:hypothetical protein
MIQRIKYAFLFCILLNININSTSAQIANIVRAMASERGEDVAQLATALSINAERIFGSFA